MPSGRCPETRETPAHFRVLHLGRSSSTRANCRPVGCHPNARVARAFPSGSPLQTREAPAQFGAVHWEPTSVSRADVSHVDPPPTGGLSRDCGRAHLNKRARPPRIFGSFSWSHPVPPTRTADRLAAIQMRTYLTRFQVGLRCKRARPPRNLERFIRNKRAPQGSGFRMLPRHQPGPVP